MKTEHFDTIVVGVGGMGSAAVYHLAQRGQRVLGLEQFDIPHDMGSSHGVTRVIRLTYFEHPSYVPLLARAYALWRELEQTGGEQLLHITGSIDAGAPDSFVVEGSISSCAEHNLAHDVLTSGELTHRFPGFNLPPEMMAVWQPDGGFLLPERCIVHHVLQAQAAGGEVRAREQVLEWQAEQGSVTVRTNRATYTAERLIFTAGAWSQSLLSLLGENAVPERQVMGWFQPAQPDLFAVGRFPVFNALTPEGHFYGFPIYGVPGFKIGKFHHLREQTAPDDVDPWVPSRRRRGAALLHATTPNRRHGGHDGVENMHVHQYAGRSLHHGPPSGACQRGDCGRLFRSRIQVLQRCG